MRLWSLHPSLLDQKGLVALWREALLAQKVLQGQDERLSLPSATAQVSAKQDAGDDDLGLPLGGP